MEVFYTAIFAAMAAVAAGLELTRSKDVASESGSREFLRFRNNYVTVYALMMGAPVGPRRSCSLLVALHAGHLHVLTWQQGWRLTWDHVHEARACALTAEHVHRGASGHTLI
jgi:hypothetical protein